MAAPAVRMLHGADVVTWWQWLFIGLVIWAALILLLVAFFYGAGDP